MAIKSENLENGKEKYELKTKINSLTQELKSSNKQIDIINAEISTLDQRLKIKNSATIDMENQIRSQYQQIMKLQDEVISWKLHSSWENDSLLIADTGINKPMKLNKEDKDPEMTEYIVKDVLIGEEKMENDQENIKTSSTKIKENKLTQKEDSNQENIENQSDIKNKENFTQAKSEGYSTTASNTSVKSVTMIGTSNTKFIDQTCRNKRTLQSRK